MLPFLFREMHKHDKVLALLSFLKMMSHSKIRCSISQLLTKDLKQETNFITFQLALIAMFTPIFHDLHDFSHDTLFSFLPLIILIRNYEEKKYGLCRLDAILN